ncbi:MAG TPA: hypothetical protein VFP70_14465 [Burkholderiales bacterium]|nr:hypothetical protein [Burkholderiales bacterium]
MTAVASVRHGGYGHTERQAGHVYEGAASVPVAEAARRWSQ